MSHIIPAQKKKKNFRQRQTKKKSKLERSRRSSFSWPNVGNNFGKRLKKYGVKFDASGNCHGVACVVAHAILSDNITQFDEDLLAIRRPINKDAAVALPQRALLEAVSLSQCPDKYPHLFSSPPTRQNPCIVKPAQDPLMTISLIQSAEIEVQGGVTVVGRFSGVYGIWELRQYLSCIRRGIERFPHPMALMLSDEGHIIVIHYHSRENVWYLVDYRSLPSRRYETDHELARAIKNILSPEIRKTVMSTVAIVTKQHEDTAKQAIQFMTTRDEWRNTHAIEESKKAYFKRWLFVAAWDGCEKEVALLLAHQVDPNKPKIGDDVPLSAAACQGKENVVSLLLRHGALANGPKNIKESPLYNAIRGGHNNIATILRLHGARLKKGERVKLMKQTKEMRKNFGLA